MRRVCGDLRSKQLAVFLPLVMFCQGWAQDKWPLLVMPPAPRTGDVTSAGAVWHQGLRCRCFSSFLHSLSVSS